MYTEYQLREAYRHQLVVYNLINPTLARYFACSLPIETIQAYFYFGVK